MSFKAIHKTRKRLQQRWKGCFCWILRLESRKFKKRVFCSTFKLLYNSQACACEHFIWTLPFDIYDDIEQPQTAHFATPLNAYRRFTSFLFLFCNCRLLTSWVLKYSILLIIGARSDAGKFCHYNASRRGRTDF